MLGLKLNHVSKRGPWSPSKMVQTHKPVDSRKISRSSISAVSSNDVNKMQIHFVPFVEQLSILRVNCNGDVFETTALSILDINYIHKKIKLEKHKSFWFPEQNSHNFFIFKCIFLRNNLLIWFKYHWSFFPKVQFTMNQHLIRYWLGTEQVTSHYLYQW